MSRHGCQGVSWCSSHRHGWRSRWRRSDSRSRSGGRLGRRGVSSGRRCCSGIPPENRAPSRFRRSRRLRLSCRGWRQCSRRHESGGWRNSRRRNRSVRRARRGCGLPSPPAGRRRWHRRSGSYSRSRSVSGCRRKCVSRSWPRRVGGRRRWRWRRWVSAVNDPHAQFLRTARYVVAPTRMNVNFQCSVALCR